MLRLSLKSAGIVLALFLLFLLLLFPASAGFALLAPAGVTGFGFSGTVWTGSAQAVRTEKIQLRELEWDLALSRLLVGQFAGNFATRWNGGLAEGFAAVSLGGKITISEAQATLDAGSLQTLLQTPPIGGELSLAVTRLELLNQWPEHLVGSAEVRNLSSQMLGSGAEGVLGSYTISFDSTTETEADSLTGKITDTGGPLEVSGMLLLTPPAQYSLKVRIKPRDETSMALRRNLDFLGPADADGAREFQLAGSI